jgi:valyl-tRNA synthetase
LVFTGEVEKAQDNEQLLKDLEYTKGFLESVEKKLANEKFVANAKPDVLANEQKKRDDAIAKIKAITESLGNIKE